MDKELNSPATFRKFADIYQDKKQLEHEIQKLIGSINRFAKNCKQLQQDIEKGKEKKEQLTTEEEKFQTNLDIFHDQQASLEKKKENIESPKELRSINKEMDYLQEQVQKKEDALLDLQEKKELLDQELEQKAIDQKELKKQSNVCFDHYNQIETLKSQVEEKRKVLLGLLKNFSLPVQHSLKEVIDKNPPDPFTSIQDYSFCKLCGVKLPGSLTRAVKTFSSYHEQNPLLRCQGCGRIIINVLSYDPE